jgi:hypothetical protein
VRELALRERKRLNALEAVIGRGIKTFVEVGTALKEIRDSRLYKAQYGTFEEYCKQRWGFTPQHGGRLIAAARTVREMEPIGSIPENEYQARQAREIARQARALALERATAGGLVDRRDQNHGQAAPVSESDFQQAVTDALTLFGWRWVHFRPARTVRGWKTALSGSPGYPDISAVRGDRIIFVELKAAKGELRDEQRSWLSALGAAGAEVHCWRPSDWPLIEDLIR